MAHILFLVLFLVLNTWSYSDGQFYSSSDPPRHEAAIRGSIQLICNYTGRDGNGEFLEWYRDDTPVSSEKVGHYVVKTSNLESRLIIKIFVKNDSSVQRWVVKTKKPSHPNYACRFRTIKIIPAPQSIKVDKEVLDISESSVRRNEDESVKFICNIESGREPYRADQIKWDFSRDHHNYESLPSEVKQAENEISIDKVKKNHRGYYRCTLNERSFIVLLRVKDRLAALWPFLGIVSIVIILVLIILIFEKRQKATRKAMATNEDDHTRDPLVRTTNKSSDNDNKKRAVKA